MHALVLCSDDIDRELAALGEFRCMGTSNCFDDLFLDPEMECDMVLYDHFSIYSPEDLQNILICGMPRLNDEVFFNPYSHGLIVADLVSNIRTVILALRLRP